MDLTVSRPKFSILWGYVEDISLLNKFFSDCRYVPYLARKRKESKKEERKIDRNHRAKI